ncbi:hypothetical protein H257_12983 [Aphanomyces astaci]|uniref:Peptide deformylase n=1 Tax=Aphanomyces astaci TaxID=112090 RepID=W4FYU5_APHAT|nr:hypothetical protein H257_12983 [Aphanomyces astaci]ETV71848.1 hypothetical protein H257_12983 [Aphanomyces astaci]|eukprot:XP_009838697.1 hypothetical protein H257_12983 [Aphanomyces astaci]
MARLESTLMAFRAKNGFDRGIAAPQIGVQNRFVAIHLVGKHASPQEDALPQAESELFQHELNHLVGILAVNLVSKDLLSADELLNRFPSHVI